MAVGDWVPCLRYGIQQDADIDLANDWLNLDIVLVGVGNASIGLAGEVATVETEATVLTKRVVGPLLFRCAFVEDHAIVIHERIRVALRDDAGLLAFYAIDLNDQNEANEPFLWERVSTLEVTGGAAPIVESWPNPVISHPGWGPLDVGVARRLRRQDALVYTCQVSQLTANPFGVGDVFSVVPFLRTWARAF